MCRISATLRLAILATLPVATACASMSIPWPRNDGDSVCPPVQIVVNWTGDVTQFGATLDGTDITSQFFVGYANKQASAQLTAPPGSHTLKVTGQYDGWFGGTGTATATRTFSVPGLQLGASPAVVSLPKNGTATSTISASGCGGPVQVTLAALPAGVAANPASFSMTLPAPSTPGISGGTSAGKSTTLTASAVAPAGQHTVAVNGTSANQSAATSFSIDLGQPSVGKPSIASVTPGIQAKGGTVNIAGTGFDPTCANNTVAIGGVNVAASACAAAGASLSVMVPAQAAYGATTVTVTVGGQTSNGLPLTVARQAGTFLAASVKSNRTNHTCVQPNGGPGNAQVQFSTVNPNVQKATYSAPGGTVGAIDFFVDKLTPPTVLNAGGAGFSTCTAGIVLDAGQPVFHLLNIETGAKSQRAFSFFMSGGGYSSPEVFRSPDGTVVLFVTAGNAQQRSLAFIDVDKGHFGQAISSTMCAFGGAPSINASNELVLTCGGQATTIPIP